MVSKHLWVYSQAIILLVLTLERQVVVEGEANTSGARREERGIPGTGSHHHWHIHALLWCCMVTGNHVREHRAGLGENQRGLSMGRETIEKQVALVSMMERRSS